VIENSGPKTVEQPRPGAPLEGINFATPFHAAERYVSLGHWPVPIPSGTKGPKLPKWQELRPSSENLPNLFPGGPQNIGLILGDDSGLADVDCDTVEATVTARVLLPATGMVFGRASKRASHYFYYLDPPLSLKTFKDPTDDKMLVELRCRKKDDSVGLQTVVPPSIHPSGEKIEFEPGGDSYPANIDADELHHAVARVASAALLARHWPEQGSRHSAMLALAGALWRAEWSLEEAQKFCRAMYLAVPTHDPAALGRSDDEVEDTYRRGAQALDRDKEPKITGWPTLAEILGEKVVGAAMKWLGSPITKTTPSTPAVNTGTLQEDHAAGDQAALETGQRLVHPYREENGGIVRRKLTKTQDGWNEETVVLTNFTARITADVGEDDGVEVKRHFEIEAKVEHRPNTFVIPAARFALMDWPIEHLGPRAIVHPNQKDWARTAIQCLSTGIEQKRIFTHTGWRRDDDSWLYLYNGGAIGAAGLVAGVDVRLSGALSRYVIKLPRDRSGLIAGVQASLRILDNAPDHITFPLLAAVYRGAVKSCDFSVFLVGPTGVFKSEEAALVQQHYGLGMDARHLPGNFASTGNALETLAFHAKDVLLVIDDFAPHGGMQDVARYHGAAERIFRAAGNSQGRGRLDSTAKLREAKAPRGLILATGEDVPHGQSIRGRTLIVEVGPGDVRTRILTENQHAAASGHCAQALGGFIQHLAGDYERLQAKFSEDVQNTRSRATTAHSRTPGIVADLQCGFELFLDYAVAVDAITVARRQELAERCWAALNRVAKAQRAPQDASEPTRRFLDLLGAALTAGSAHVAAIDGNRPEENETAWGWRWEDGGRDPKCVAKGRCVGWIDGDNIYLEPTSAYTIVQEFGRASGEPLVVSQIALVKRLKEKGLLASVDATRETNTIRKRILGASKNVLHLKARALLGDVGFSDANVGSMSGFSEEPDISLGNRNNHLQGNVGFVGRNTGGESLGGSAANDAAAREMEVVEI
jgi:hypothetical protein